MDLTLQHLRMLREVSRKKTIAAAADSLGYTRSAVSQQLVGLEKSTGVAVLERVGRGVQLTDAGRELVRHADDLLAGMEAAQAAIEQIAGAVRGRLEVSSFESVTASLLPAILTEVSERHPEVELRTRQADPERGIEAVSAGEVDMAFNVDYPHSPSDDGPEIVQFPIMEELFHLVVPANDPIEKTIAPLALFSDRNFVAPSTKSGYGRSVVDACRAAGFEPSIAHLHDYYPATLHLVESGHGVALVSEMGLAVLPDGVRVVELENPVCRTVQLAYRTSSADRPVIAAVCTITADLAAEMSGCSAGYGNDRGPR